MDKKQAITILNGLVSILHEKGGIQVTPKDFETIKAAVDSLTLDELKVPTQKDTKS